ncbi:MAG TPA: phosphoribosylformylglycinamidine cyclo-ligase [Caldisericia bacterium]|nr:phosphoribosylformylglycinamidine cyclo-ligase [Caldisericia bacterium]HOR46989.1 phosphoribosylformylglycinamidine cyclo-ligase [Caldisericia bacterium]HOU07926.1 phosphoribosylformylglycinamidine cyclo-ligase [Caldisericia bacterium]HPL90109.1 phosphoribosylformylglycinamidine cyclo-ligase [Caldisericia bacterium]HQG60344.1 phosphoribosylformylglycinamidine cyclo-ligase [Caldisericia bacterium]
MSKAYESTGVSIDASDRFVEKIKEAAKRTIIPGVLGGIGFFGGFFEVPKGYSNPVMVSGADGVGTKVKIAQALGKHDTVGIDCVAMNVDDIVCSGAKPLYFLDYLAVNRLDEEVSYQIIKGVAEGCVQAGCALIGGETAQMGDIYQPNEYDLAGFAVGIVEKSKIIDGSKIKKGDIIVGLPSSGLHSNGYSLVRKIASKYSLDSKFDGIDHFGLALLEPTKIYAQYIVKIAQAVELHGISHITGGGLADNLPRIMGSGKAVVKRNSLPKIPIIEFLIKEAKLSDEDAFRTFNMGIGMALFVPEEEASKTMSLYPGSVAIGTVEGDGEPSFGLV